MDNQSFPNTPSSLVPSTWPVVNNSEPKESTGTNTGDETEATILAKLGLTELSGDNTGDETETTILTKLGLTELSGVNTGDQMLMRIGDQTSDNYYKIAEWTLTGAYGTFASHVSVMTTSKCLLAELYILCALDGDGDAFADPTFKLSDVFGGLGTSTFYLTVNNTGLKATLYFKNATDYEPHYITRIDSILNATTVVYSNTDTTSASNPTGTYAKGPTVV